MHRSLSRDILIKLRSALSPKPKSFNSFVQCPAEKVFEAKLVGPKLFSIDEGGLPGLAAQNVADGESLFFRIGEKLNASP